MRSALLLTLPALVAPAQTASPKPIPAPKATSLIDVRVDQRFELMCIVFRMADFVEYNTGKLPEYLKAVEAHFGPFKDHPTIQMARGLRNQVCYGDIPTLAVRTQDAITFKPTIDLTHPDFGLEAGWKPETALKFLQAMAVFSRDTRTDAFFKAQAPFYAKQCEHYREKLLKPLNVSWYTRTFGPQERNTYHLCPAPLNGMGNYGVYSPNRKGGSNFFAFIDTNRAEIGSVQTVVHEFLHSFVNPWVDRHMAELKAHGEALSGPFEKLLNGRKPYAGAYIAVTESMVRAFTIRYFMDQKDDAQVRSETHLHNDLGFYWINPLVELLGEYTQNRDRYKDLEAFTPRLVEAFKTWASKADVMAAAAKAENQKRAEAEKAAKSQAEVGASK